MRILVIIATKENHVPLMDNIRGFRDFMQGHDVEYAGISSSDDFENYEHIIQFKYKLISPKFQLTKICDFISDYKDALDYDWYIKIRPEVQLLSPIVFHELCDKSINARARLYKGPKYIANGCSIGEGMWAHIKDKSYSDVEEEVILDDIMYIFHKNVIDMGGLDVTPEYYAPCEDEWFHTKYWKQRGIGLNIIGIDMVFTRAKGMRLLEEETARSTNIGVSLALRSPPLL